MSNTKYVFDGPKGIGTIPDGTQFLFDADKFDLIKDVNWYRNYTDPDKIDATYIQDRSGIKLHSYFIKPIPGYEVDHKNMNTFDNRMDNLRLVTHQQNQCNQGLQRNNTSGVAGVSFYRSRNKYRSRIKVCQHDIHLGYFMTFLEAVQARNVGMECLFGEYGRYNEVPEAPKWIRDKVYKKCKGFAGLAIGGAFFVPGNIEPNM